VIVQKRKSIPNIEINNFKFDEVTMIFIVFRVSIFLTHKKTCLKMFQSVLNKLMKEFMNAQMKLNCKSKWNYYLQ